MKREWYSLAIKARKLFNQATTTQTCSNHSLVEGKKAPESNTHRIWSRSDITSLALVSPEYVHFCPNQACHAGLANSTYAGFPREKATRIAAISLIQDRKNNEDDCLKYYDYLINRSPWADAFVNRSAKDTVANGAIFNTDIPANYMAGAMMATRMCTEYRSWLPLWIEMVKLGAPERLADILCYGATLNTKTGLVSYQSYCGHCPIDTARMTGALSYIKGEMKNPNVGTYQDSYDYRGVNDLWNNNEVSLKNVVSRLIDAAKKRVEGKLLPKPNEGYFNPFKKAQEVPDKSKAVGKTCYVESFTKEAIQWLEENK